MINNKLFFVCCWIAILSLWCAHGLTACFPTDWNVHDIMQLKHRVAKELHFEKIGDPIISSETVRLDDGNVVHRTQTLENFRIHHPAFETNFLFRVNQHERFTVIDFSEVYLALMSVYPFLVKDFVLPHEIKVDLARESNEFDQPKFRRVGSDLTLTLTFHNQSFDGTRKRKHPKYTWKSHIHELGHLIFYFALLKRSKVAREYYSMDFTKQMNFGRERDYFISAYLIASYDELFADLITVLAYQDPTIMYKGFNYIGDEWRKNNLWSIKLRDFSNEIYPKDSPGYRTDPHVLLSPVRYHLYEYFLKRPQFMSKNPEGLLTTLFDAMVSEINTLMPKTFYKPYDDLPFEILVPRYPSNVLNQRLIDEFEKRLRIFR